MKCGIDIVSVKRIEDLVIRRGGKKLCRIWTENEIKDCTKNDGSFDYQSLAGRYAVKEAVSKAFGTGFGRCGVNAEEIEVIKDSMGKPVIELHGTTKIYYENKGYNEISVSLSHEGDIATAVCVLTGGC